MFQGLNLETPEVGSSHLTSPNLGKVKFPAVYRIGKIFFSFDLQAVFQVMNSSCYYWSGIHHKTLWNCWVEWKHIIIKRYFQALKYVNLWILVLLLFGDIWIKTLMRKKDPGFISTDFFYHLITQRKKIEIKKRRKIKSLVKTKC